MVDLITQKTQIPVSSHLHICNNQCSDNYSGALPRQSVGGETQSSRQPVDQGSSAHDAKEQEEL